VTLERKKFHPDEEWRMVYRGDIRIGDGRGFITIVFKSRIYFLLVLLRLRFRNLN
jgi:hypothetical protein